MKHLNKLKCWLIGHDPYYLEFYHGCLRCEQDLSFYELTKEGVLNGVPGYFIR